MTVLLSYCHSNSAAKLHFKPGVSFRWQGDQVQACSLTSSFATLEQQRIDCLSVSRHLSACKKGELFLHTDVNAMLRLSMLLQTMLHIHIAALHI